MAGENSTLAPRTLPPVSANVAALDRARAECAIRPATAAERVDEALTPPMVVETFVGKLGYPASMLPALAALELFCAAVYAVPRTAVLGAVLLTGYLGARSRLT